jgi:nucleoside-diphosphate-sugar epimerase
MASERRLFLAGATGVIGVQLIPLLVQQGFRVAGMTRSTQRGKQLEQQGAEPVVCDVYDRDQLVRAVREFGPDVVMHQLTDLPDDAQRIQEFLAANSRIRTEGTRNLIDAAETAGAQAFIAQSIAWELPGEAGKSVTEHERMVLDFGGVVARYGMFYGPGTYHPDDVPDHPRVHVADAAARTVELIDAPSGIVTVVDATGA